MTVCAFRLTYRDVIALVRDQDDFLPDEHGVFVSFHDLAVSPSPSCKQLEVICRCYDLKPFTVKFKYHFAASCGCT